MECVRSEGVVACADIFNFSTTGINLLYFTVSGDLVECTSPKQLVATAVRDTVFLCHSSVPNDNSR